MAHVVRFPAAFAAELVEEPPPPMTPTGVRIETEYSGISAGTELTAYRGLNPLLDRRWDPERRLFLEDAGDLAFPIVGWGYEEVGVVVEVGGDCEGVAVGERVWGSWGHRSERVLPAAIAASRKLPPGSDPLLGIFAKIGAIALNAVVDAEPTPGETVTVFGLGVPGQLVAQFARLAGARVVGVDPDAFRRQRATDFGCEAVIDPSDGDVGLRVRELTGGRGADAAIEISGSSSALHQAIRSVGYNSRVVVSGFHQGPAAGLRLGEEFHHNRITLVSSQISGVAAARDHRWDELRLSQAAIDAVCAGRVRARELISHIVPAADVGDAFALLDRGAPETLQVVLDFRTPADSQTPVRRDSK